MNKPLNTTAATAALWLAVVTCAQAQNWNGTKLNSIAVTNETGAIIVSGTDGSFNNSANATKAAVFDGNTGTFFDPESNTARTQACWAGFELQAQKMVTRVGYYGRTGNAHRMRGCLFQGANLPDFSDAVTLHVANPPATWGGASWVEEWVTSTNALRAYSYLRIIGPNIYGSTPGEFGTCCGNAAEVEFYGMDLPDPQSQSVPAVPVVSSVIAVNWRANMRWTPVANAMCYEVLRKLPHEAEFTQVLADCFRPTTLRQWADPFALSGPADYRIRALNLAGASDWVDVPIQPRNAAAGVWFGTQGSHDNAGRTGDKVYDGDVDTFFDGPAITGNFWSALDLGTPKEIVSVRYMPRTGMPERIVGGWFEAANNEAFVGAVTLHTISSQPTVNAMTEVAVPPELRPARYRYVRFVTPPTGFGNAQEVEFVLASDSLAAPAGLAVASSDMTNDYAVLSWQPPVSKTLFSSSIVCRATAPGGPYAEVAAFGQGGRGWMDTNLVVGIMYYYKVCSAFSDGTTFLTNRLSESPSVSFRRSERLERTWDDNSQLKTGLTWFNIGGTYQDNPNWDADKIFDGSLSTFADIKPATGTVGVDFKVPHAVSRMRFVPRTSDTGRANGALLLGSNDLVSTATTLATFSNAVANTYRWIATTNDAAYRYIFAARYDGQGFYGNLAELELYGWPASNVVDVLTAPSAITFTPNVPTVQISWTAGNNAATYRIERAFANAPDDWQPVGTANTPTLTDNDPAWATNCLYRIASVRQDGQDVEEVAWSESIPFAAYMPGNGTGLAGYYSSGFTKAYSPVETQRFERLDARIDFAWAGSPIIPDVPASSNNVLVTWNGKLVVPYDGIYTFHATADDGVALRIGDAFIINDWLTATNTRSASIALTNGTYEFRMDYYQFMSNAYARLEWDGAVPRAVIPTAQLIPAPLPADTAPWQGRTFNAPKLGSHAIDPATGAITVSSGGMDFHAAAEGHHFVWQPVRGTFLFEAKVEQAPLGITSAKAMLMMRSSLESGSPLLAAGRAAATPAIYGGKQRLTSGAAIANTFDPWLSGATSPCWLRLTRSKDTVTMAIRNDGGDWTTFYNDTSAGAAFSDEVLVGVAVSASAVGADGTLPSAVFSDIRLIPLTGTVLIVQ